MRFLFWFWLTPLVLFWSWFGLSYYDINFGFLFLRRELHDLVFQIYGSILGVEPSTIPVLFLKACIFDTFLIFGIIAYRKRGQIRQWWAARRGAGEAISENLDTAEAVQVPAE
ncbi:DUF6105 family protein [Oricola nitratireducens]|uniref:DUF6105 family protein n=1 Tax=Oricola nitratireducens TaxID=2775868 RepID=UPI0018672643|nr:DUF6105 family protein [Oricola nitratireducens]